MGARPGKLGEPADESKPPGAVGCGMLLAGASAASTVCDVVDDGVNALEDVVLVSVVLEVSVGGQDVVAAGWLMSQQPLLGPVELDEPIVEPPPALLLQFVTATMDWLVVRFAAWLPLHVVALGQTKVFTT